MDSLPGLSFPEFMKTTLGLKGAVRGLGLGGLHPVPGTNLCRDWVDSTQFLVQTSAEDLSLVQFELYRGGVQNLHPP